MPFTDEASALIVARSDAIMSKLSREYPTIIELFNHNLGGTIEWLKAEGALAGYDVCIEGTRNPRLLTWDDFK